MSLLRHGAEECHSIFPATSLSRRAEKLRLPEGEPLFLHASASIQTLYTGGTSGEHSEPFPGHRPLDGPPRGQAFPPARGHYGKGDGRECQIGASGGGSAGGVSDRSGSPHSVS
jgi:hypothetical protein